MQYYQVFISAEQTAQPEPVDAVVALTFVPTEQIPARTKSSNGDVGTRT